MEILDVIFANRFIKAHELWKSEKNPSESLRLAFEARKNSKLLVLQHLFLGINTHFNLGLGIAASDTMVRKNHMDIRGHFDKINSVLAELVDGVKAKISTISPSIRITDSTGERQRRTTAKLLHPNCT